MFKFALFALAAAGGAAGAASWLLSDSEPTTASPPVSERVQLLKARFAAAQAEGKIAAGETENRVRHELDTYRLHPDRPATSS